MRTILVFIAILGFVVSDEQLQLRHHIQEYYIPIIHQYQQINPDHSYNYGYETANGIRMQENGYLKNPGDKKKEAQVKLGAYSFTSPEGIPYAVYYTADKNGYRAKVEQGTISPPSPNEIKSYETHANKKPGQNLKFHDNANHVLNN